MTAAPPPSSLSYLRIDLGDGLVGWWARAKRVTRITALVLIPIGAVLIVIASLDGEMSAAMVLVSMVALALIDLFYALCFGLVIATIGLMWRLFGVALVFTAILAPLAFIGVLWLCGPWLGAIGALTIELWAAEIAAHPAVLYEPTLQLGAVGHAGPVALLILAVVLLPLLAFWIGNAVLLLITPPVLWAFLGLVAAVCATIGLSLAAALLIAAPPLGVALVRRFRRRHREYIAAQSAVQSAEGGARGHQGPL